MGSSTISCSNFNPKSTQRNHNSALERRPRLLKDFLYDDSNSCSSNGFKSFPRKSSQNSSIFRENLNHGPKLQRSQSKAASTTISAFQAVINAVKSIHFVSSVKLSRKMSKRDSQSSRPSVENKVTMTVKDIIRWKSFRDLVEEKSQPSDFASSSSPPHHCTTTTTTTGSNTPCSSNGSSWCDSDFTSSEYSPPDEFGGNEVDRKKFLLCGVGNSKDPMETTTKTTANTYMGPKYASEDKEQHSPLWVLDFGYEEKLECEMAKLVKAWIDEEHNETTKWRLADKTEACVRDMENEGKWKNFKFDEEQEELALGVERWVLNILVDELLLDLL